MKKTINNAEDLAWAIAELEQTEAAQKRELQEAYKMVTEDLKPVNLLKSGLRSVFSSEHQGDIFNALLGVGSGFVGRKLLLGKANGFVGKAVQWGLAGLVSKNAEKIKEKAGELIDRLFRKSKPGENHSPAFPEDQKKIHS